MHGITEGQCVAAGAGYIGRDAVGEACLQQQCGRAASGVDRHCLVEGGGDGNGIAHFVAAIRCGGADIGYPRVEAVDRDIDVIGIGLCTTAAAAAQVTGGDRQDSCTVVAAGRRVRQGGQGGVNIGNAAAKDQAGVRGAIASGE